MFSVPSKFFVLLLVFLPTAYLCTMLVMQSMCPRQLSVGLSEMWQWHWNDYYTRFVVFPSHRPTRHLGKKIHIWDGAWREPFDLQTKMVISVCLQIHICVTPVDQETSGPGFDHYVKCVSHTYPTPHCLLSPKSRPPPFEYLLFTFCLNLPFPVLCSYCIKCYCFICSGSTHWLRPTLCLSVHQFTGILWINTSPQQTAQQDLNDFLQHISMKRSTELHVSV